MDWKQRWICRCNMPLSTIWHQETWGEYAESNRDRKERKSQIHWEKKKKRESVAKEKKQTTTACKTEKVRRALHGIVAGLSCLQVLRDQPVPPRREGSGLSQHTQAALLAEALWHGCGCCSQSVTARSHSPSPLFSPSHSVILNHPYSTPPCPPPLPPTLTHSQSASHAVWKKNNSTRVNAAFPNGLI